MPYIDKEKFRMHIVLYQHNPLKVKLTDKEKEKFIRMLDEVPTADVIKVVRCKDCVHYNAGFECLKEGYGIEYPPDYYCADGERKENGAE